MNTFPDLLAALSDYPYAIRDARGAVHLLCVTEQEAVEGGAHRWNAETDPRQRVDDGAYPFVAGLCPDPHPLTPEPPMIPDDHAPFPAPSLMTFTTSVAASGPETPPPYDDNGHTADDRARIERLTVGISERAATLAQILGGTAQGFVQLRASQIREQVLSATGIEVKS